MTANRIALALALAGLAAPALAEKCHICDFSDEPIVVKTTHSTGGGSGNDTLNSGFGNDIMSRRHGTDSVKAMVTPLDPPAGLAAAPAKPHGHEIREHVSFTYQKIIWNHASKPKEIVVVGSKINEPKAPLSAAPATHVMKGTAILQNAPPAMPTIRR